MKAREGSGAGDSVPGHYAVDQNVDPGVIRRPLAHQVGRRRVKPTQIESSTVGVIAQGAIQLCVVVGANPG